MDYGENFIYPSFLDKTKAYLDEIYSDKSLIMNTGNGHSILLSAKALEWAGIDAAYAKKYGYDLVHVDPNGELKFLNSLFNRSLLRVNGAISLLVKN